jgi:integrase
MKTNLTAAYIENVALPDRGQQDIYDTKERGLILRVSDSGRKSWNVFYRHEGRNRRMTLGKYPHISLADARRLAKKHLSEAAVHGKDPAAEKLEKRAADTFGELADTYLEQHAKRTKRTWAEDERIIKKELKPIWGSRKAAEITRRDVRQLLDRIVGRGAEVMANRVLALVSKIFSWAVDREDLENSPAYKLKRPGEEHQRDRVLSDKEIRALWSALDDEPFPVAAFFRLGLLTAQRRGEILGMQWAEIDLDSGWWTIASERAKNELSHRVPLFGEALAIIRQLRDTAKADAVNVFPGPRGKAISNPQKWVKRVRDATKIDFKYHDLRRTAASDMAGIGVQRLVISKLLNHAEQGVTAVYERHGYDSEKRAALEKWDGRLNQIIAGERAKVVPIRAQPVAYANS